MVDEERSAKYREALRELREARDAKYPDRAILEVVFKFRASSEEYCACGRQDEWDEMSLYFS